MPTAGVAPTATCASTRASAAAARRKRAAAARRRNVLILNIEPQRIEGQIGATPVTHSHEACIPGGTGYASHTGDVCFAHDRVRLASQWLLNGDGEGARIYIQHDV